MEAWRGGWLYIGDQRMTINVRLFAILRVRAGLGEIQIDLPAGATVADAFAHLSSQIPSMKPLFSKLAFAVNQNYVPGTTELFDGDELALIPPVSEG